MNRRKFFPFIGIASVASLLSPKLSASPTQHDDMWMVEQCKHHIDGGGRYWFKPRDTEVVTARLNSIHGWSSEPNEQDLIKISEAEIKFSRDMREWESSPICGEKFKRLRGTTTRCPKCGGQASGDKDQGVLV